MHLETFREPLDPSRIKGNVLQQADWAALASMGVELVVPIVLRGELAAFICLGGKGSGDVFTATDAALLSGLADKAADELLRFEQAEVERQTRDLSEQLRNFVPAAVVRELDEGFRLDPGEREVSVLFVDIRGYTPFAEGQRPDAIFAAVSQYTEAVSGVVDECGGSVVEFHGDGLMAVFGAPRPLEAKESCAVRAALTISTAIPELDIRGANGEPHRLDVGVGVATGSAYVGPLKTADRVIWVALGNTTNLAARLEGKTRDLDVSVIVDSATHEAAGSVAQGFVHQTHLRVKGRSAPLDIFTWSRDAEEIGS
jgi:class 3 adenylate cyclase